MNQSIVTAIRERRILQFNYGGGMRTVEPHCYGITTAGHYGLRAYQVSGYSSEGVMGWKLFDLGKTSYLIMSEERFEGPRPDYKRGDKGMKTIITQL